MDNSEKDPKRCRVLRAAITEYQDQIRRYGNSIERYHSEADKMQSEIRDLRAKHSRLVALQVAGDAAGTAFPSIGLAASTLDVSLSARISVVELQIESRQRDLRAIEANISKAQKDFDFATRQLTANSQTANSLNCVP